MPLNIDWQQILLHLLNFVILFAILYFLLYKPIKDFMQKRMDYYKSLYDEANKIKQQQTLYNKTSKRFKNETDDVNN